MSPARLAFIQGFCAALAPVLLFTLLVIPQYSRYQQRAEISHALATARPLQNQIAEKLKNQQPIGSIPPHPTATTRISADGWVLLTTPRYQRQIILIPSRQANGEITWEPYFEHGELRR